MARNNETPIRVGLLGAGTVGSQTARLIVEQKDELSARIGRPVELTGVACLDPKETEKFPWIDQSIVTTDTLSVATNSDIVIELIGGTTVARKFVLAAIESGASVVTANKALLAKYGPEIYSAAEAKGVDIYFEAAVGGAIPFLRPLRESLVGDKVTSMLGIVNGTTNYILDEITAPMIHRSILALRFGCRTLSDPNSRKKDRIEFFESIFLKNPVASSKLVTDVVENPAWSLNLHHETWCNPWDKRIASKASFPDLFKQSLGKLSTIFYMINSMLDTGQPLRKGSLEMLLSELGNYSYHSGLPCIDE